MKHNPVLIGSYTTASIVESRDQMAWQTTELRPKVRGLIIITWDGIWYCQQHLYHENAKAQNYVNFFDRCIFSLSRIHENFCMQIEIKYVISIEYPGI